MCEKNSDNRLKYQVTTSIKIISLNLIKIRTRQGLKLKIMKTKITLCFIIITSIKGFGQQVSFDSAWRSSLYGEFKLAGRLGIDSCYYSCSLLKVDLDEGSRVIAMLFSDNADDVMKGAFIDIFTKENQISPALESEARKAKVKDISLLLPITIASWGSCPQAVNEILYNEHQYKFKDKYLTGRCLFLEPLILTIDGRKNK